MLRRVARLVQIGLFALGVLALVWAPVSLYLAVVLKAPWPGSGSAVMSTEAALIVAFFPGRYSDESLAYDARIERVQFLKWSEIPLWPSVETQPYLWIEFPLWLLAFLCLAWPV